MPDPTEGIFYVQETAFCFRKADQGFAVGSALFAQLSWVLRVKFNRMWVQALTMSLTACAHNRSLSIYVQRLPIYKRMAKCKPRVK